jgi:aspartyl-tRNA(Asn)/glutamyl-tRNA(Gln) amidotransferase subunit A
MTASLPSSTQSAPTSPADPSDTPPAPSPDKELAWLSARELGKRYRDRSLSPVEAVGAILSRIERFNPDLNAFAYLDPESALSAARDSEERYAQGRPLGALDGIPVSLKDLLLARGWPTRRGSLTVSADGPWNEDSPAAARLREQGAVLLGKTTTSEFGLKGGSTSPLTGSTRNPWDLSRSPGGSSAGAVTAVAAGFGPLAVGTDGGGSIRAPASYAGVVGFKPTFGRVPTYPSGVVGAPPHVGPIARSASDASLLFETLAGVDIRDPYRLPPLTGAWDTEPRSLKGLRIGVSATLGYVDVDPEVLAAFEQALSILRDCGAEVTRRDPGFPSPSAIQKTLFEGRAAQTVAGLSTAQRRLLEPGVEEAARAGEALTALEYLRAETERTRLSQRMADYHRHFDLLVTPATAGTAPSLAGEPARERGSLVGPFALTRQPAISIPIGLSRSGLPIGLQMVGRLFEDELVLRTARAFETHRGFIPPPAYL